MKMNLRCKNKKLGSPNNSCLLEFLGKGKALREKFRFEHAGGMAAVKGRGEIKRRDHMRESPVLQYVPVALGAGSR